MPRSNRPASPIKGIRVSIARSFRRLPTLRRRLAGLIVAFSVLAMLATGLFLVRGRAAAAGLQWPAVIAKIFANRVTRALSPTAPAGVTYFSQGSLPPELPASWGTLPLGGTAPLDFTSGDIFVIQNTHNMSTLTTWALSGSGSKLQISSGGTLTANNAVTLALATQFQIDAGGTYVHNNAIAYGGSIFQGVESFAPTSTVILNNSNTTGPSNVAFGNLTVDFSTAPSGSVNLQGQISTINGSLTIIDTLGQEFRLSGNTDYTLTIGGDLIIQGGSLNLANATTLTANHTYVVNIGGSFNQTGGVFNHSNSNANAQAIINFTGGSSFVTFVRSAGTFTIDNINWTIAGGKTVQFNDDFALPSPRTFTVASGGMLLDVAQFLNSGVMTVNGEYRLTDDGGAAGSNFIYGAGGTLGFVASTSYVVNSPTPFWPVTNSPTNVTVLGLGITLNGAVPAVSGLFETFAGVDGAGNLTVNGTCQISPGGFFSGSPTHGASSLLKYNTGGTYGRAGEWLPGAVSGGGYPHNVQLSNNTLLNLPNSSTSSPFQLSGTLTIDSGSTMELAGITPMTAPLNVLGSVANSGTLRLSTASGGNISVTGNLTNNGTYTHNGRTLTFNGVGTQSWADTGGGTDFGAVVVNKSGNGVSLGSALSVQTLTLTSGNVTTTSTNLLTVSNTAPGAIAGSSASYINGPLARVLPASLAGTTTYAFPVGKAGFNPFELVNPTTNSGGPVILQAEEFDGNSGGTAGAGLASLNTNRYWGASITAGGPNFSNTSVRLTDSGLTATDRIGKSNAVNGTYDSIGGTVAGATIQSDVINSFSFFNVGTAAAPCVPPSIVYVDDSWVGITPGTDPDGVDGPATDFGCDSFATIQEGIDGAAAGGTVAVANGTYDEDISITNAGLQLIGAGAGTTNIRGPIGGPGATVQLFSSNNTVAGFTITRLGNNPTDWNNPLLNTPGIAIQGQAITGAVIRDNMITGNRTGVDINNSNGHTVRNNVIDFNRTGFIFRNQTDNMTVVENFITNNWTVGILFLDASSGSNSPVQRAAHSNFSNNNISANWYGQIVDRQTGVSLPLPATTNYKNFRGNWFGTTSPVITTANSAEPGYDAQIPVAFGGTATPPGGQPDVAGAASANFKFTPFLTSDTDTNVETVPGRGTNGFQGVANDITVQPANQNGWVFFDDLPGTGTGTGGFEPGPATAPLGEGSAFLQVDDLGRHALGTGGYGGTRMDDVTDLRYSTYQNTLNPNYAISLQFEIDYDLTDPSNTFQGRLVFEPYISPAQGAVQQNVWQPWDALAGNWYGTRTTVTVNNVAGVSQPCQPGTPCTWQQVLGLFPNAGVRNTPFSPVLFKAGGPWAPNFDGNVDAFHLGINTADVTYDFEPDPSLSINDVTHNEGNAGTTEYTFNVTLSRAVSQTVTVDVATADDSAAAPSDYTSVPTTQLVFNSGETSKPVIVLVNGDTAVEPDEQFFVNLSNVNANAEILDAQGVGTVTNDDAQFSINDVTLSEGNAGTTAFTFNVTKSGANGFATAVEFATADGTAKTANGDYAANSGTLNFGPTDTTMPITVLVNGDLTPESNETFFVNLSNPAGASILDAQGLGTITNDDGPPLVVYVDDDWVAVPNGTDPDGAGPATEMGFDAFATIQGGVNAVASGGTVNVAEGTYTENVTITQPLTLKGAQFGVDARGRVASESTVSPATASSPTFTVSFNGTITIDGFAFTGGTALGVIQTTVGPNNNMQIANNRFSGYSQSALFLNRGGTDITIDKNVMNGSNITGSGQAIFCNGPQIFNGLFITNNNVVNNTGRAGFFVDGNHNVGESATRAPLIGGNLFDNNNVGMNLGSRSFGKQLAPTVLGGPYAGFITNNTFSNNAFDGVQGGIQRVLVNGNTFSGNDRSGLALTSFGNTGADRGAQNSDIISNTFTGNGTVATTSGEAILCSSTQGAGTISTNHAHFNRIVGNVKGTRYEGTETIDVENNWWGCNAGPNQPGCDTVTGAGAANTDFDPWIVLLGSATPNSITPGGTSTVAADMTHNSDNLVPVVGTLPNIPVDYSATNGDMDPTSDTIVAGSDSSTFTSTNTNDAVATISVDNQDTEVQITVNEPSFSIDDVSHQEGNGGTTTYTFTVTKTGATAFSSSVNFTTEDGSATTLDNDYELNTGLLTFTSTETTKQITVLVNGDVKIEYDEDFTVKLSGASGASISDDTGLGTIENDDNGTLIVNSTNDVDDLSCDAAHCSLREAINAANSINDSNNITFEITVLNSRFYYKDDSGTMTENGQVTLANVMPTSAPDDSSIADLDPDYQHSWWSIAPTSSLPEITAPVWINGYTQLPCPAGPNPPSPCSQVNTDANADNAILLIELNGANPLAAGDGLVLSSAAIGSRIDGLVINRFSGNGIKLSSNNSAVSGNFIGTDVSGTKAAGNNVGVLFDHGSANEIGCSVVEDRNLISGNAGDGVTLNGIDAVGNFVQGNLIGTDRTGTLALANGDAGIAIFDSVQNVIGLDSFGFGMANLIANNTGPGVEVETAATPPPDPGIGNAIRGNSIHSNGGLGIDLGPGGVTANDTGDGDTGANNLQNFPEIKAVVVGTPNTISGILNSMPSQAFTIDFYSNLPGSCDPSGNGEGRTYLGSGTTTTDANGLGGFRFNPAPGSLNANDIITATATDYAGNTSEFSVCKAATAIAFGQFQFAPANTPNTNDAETLSGTHVVNIVVQRVGGADRAVSVDYEITDGTAATADNDYSATNGTLTWANGDATTRNIPITVNGDAKFEPDETVNIKLVNATGGATIAGTNPVTLTITNDDNRPTISINDVAQNEGNGPGAASHIFAVSLSNPSSETVTVDFSTANGLTNPATGGVCGTPGVDYATQTGTVTFTPEAISQPITIQVCGDNTHEQHEQFVVNLANDTNSSGITDTQGLGTITNDDPVPAISISDAAAQNEGNFHGLDGDLPDETTHTFTVSLFNPSDQTITVDYATANGTATAPSDYNAVTTTTLTFLPGETSKPVTVVVKGDTTYELDETFLVNLSNPSSNATINDDQGSGSITNDDAAPTLAINNRSNNEGTVTPSLPLPASTMTFTVTKTGSTDVTATVNFATADGSATGNAAPCPSGFDYQTQTGSLSFGPTETTKTITVSICKDATFEGNETFLVNLSVPAHATFADDQGQGTILNDDIPGGGFVVNTTDDLDDTVCDATHCSLREAITAANGSATAVAVTFAIPAGDSRHFYYQDDGAGNPNGQVTFANVATTIASDDSTIVGIDPDWPHSWWSILPTSQLQATTKQVFMDGYSQTGTAFNTLTTGTNAILRIELNGTSAGLNATGLTISGGTSTVRGLVINRFQRDGSAPTPTGNALSLPSGNNTVSGNFIGTDVSGTLDVGSLAGLVTGSGISTTSFNNVIGGTTPDVINLIAGNDTDGVSFSNSNTNVIQGNFIGTKANGASALGNGASGISFTGLGSVANIVGGPDPGEANTIASNGADGISLSNANFGNTIRGNSIFSNGTTNLHLGIDLGADGVTTNDNLDADSGPNNLQNFPIITAAMVTGSTRTISGTLNSSAGESFIVDFYQSPACDTVGGNGEGKTYLGSTSVTTNATTGDATFTFHPSVLMTIGQFVTATATSTGAGFDTSEFSACTLIADGSPGAGDIQFTDATYTVGEAGGTASITVTRVGGTNGSVTSTFSTSNGTAQAPGDYTAVNSFSITYVEGETGNKTVNVSISEDALFEGNETVFLALGSTVINATRSKDSLQVQADPHAAVLTITENDTAPTFAINDVTHDEGNAGTTSYTFTVTKTGSTALNATVDYATVNGTATAPDFTAIPATTLTFLPADTTKQFTVQVNGDTTVELDEAFTVHLSNAGNATISDADGTGTITNDDTDVSVAVSQLTVAEDGAPNLVYTFTRNGVTSGALTVNFAVAGSADFATDYAQTGAATFSATSGTVTFGAGNATAAVTINPATDLDVESDENVILTLTSGAAYNVASPNSATGTISNDDTDVTVAVSPSAVAEDGVPNLVYTFTRVGVTAGALTVNFSATGTAVSGSDYTPPGAATFDAGSSTTTVTVDPSVDATVESDETVILTLTAGTGYNVASPSSATATITNDDTDVTVAVSPSSVTEDGAPNLVYTFTRNGVTTGALTVNFAVAGSADFATDYTETGAASFTAANGTVTFGAGNAAAAVTLNPATDLIFESDETVILTVTSGAGYNVASPNSATGTITDDDSAGGIIRFSSAFYSTTENSRFATITVERVGETSGAVTVDFATPDDSDSATVVPCATVNGLASPRCDFTTAMGTLRFAAAETSKTFTVLISQDNYVEGAETLTLTLSNLTGGAVFGVPATATLTIDDDLTEPATNPIDDAENFVRQHYHDFLNREPDAGGLAFWTDQITSCGTDAACIQDRRIHVSAAFYLSIEFQGTGYFVERMYKAAYGDATGTSTNGGAHTLPVPVVRFSEFLFDTQEIGQGVIVGQTGWETALDNNKAAFATRFVQRSRFTTEYPAAMTPAAFVDKLNTNAGNPLSPAERDLLVAELTSGTGRGGTRAGVLRAVVEDSDLVTAEFNRAFVLMQYFGYLRRNPNAAPDSDYSGYDFWLTKLNEFNGNFVNAEMVKAFITSGEYRARF